MTKPILCLDFDGVLHSYTSGWQGVDIISDDAVQGAVAFLKESTREFDVQIFSSRSADPKNGIPAMQQWLLSKIFLELPFWEAKELFRMLSWPTVKPPAFLTIDDRAIQFTGEWPSIEMLLKFQPWNKK